MPVRDILLLGNPQLYEVCPPVEESDLNTIDTVIRDLHDTMMDFRQRYGKGRAIAAPQIGVMKRIVYMHIEKPVVFINPVLEDKSRETIVLWDDCMSFPDLLVKVSRHATCRIDYLDRQWLPQGMALEGDLSELLQHECDHLDGILAVSRALDGKSFSLVGQGGK
jgi:peptide deformylase